MLLEAQLEKQLQSASTDSQSQSEEITHVSAHSCLKAYSLKHNMRYKSKVNSLFVCFQLKQILAESERQLSVAMMEAQTQREELSQVGFL